MIAIPSQRVGVFFDVQNIYHSAKHLYGARVSFEKLIQEVVKDRTLIRAVAYVVKSDVVPGEQSFFDALQAAGMELRVKDLQVYASGAKKADWDVGMAVDAIRMSPLLDVIILITGDGDFVPLVEYLRWGMGKQVEVCAFGKTTSAKLIEATDAFTDLDKEPKLRMAIRKVQRTLKK